MTPLGWFNEQIIHSTGGTMDGIYANEKVPRAHLLAIRQMEGKVPQEMSMICLRVIF